MLNKRTRTKQNRKLKGLYAVIFSITVLFIVLASLQIKELLEEQAVEVTQQEIAPPPIQENYITLNKYSRPGSELETVQGIVVHYTANPGTSAIANRNYFNNLKKINKKKKNKTYASSHFVIGIEGEIVQCIPLNEIAYASNDRNSDTISIECCHERKDGRFTEETYSSLVALTTYLCQQYQLTEKNVIRHYDVTGKNCPKYFVEHEDAWQRFLSAVAAGLPAAE